LVTGLVVAGWIGFSLLASAPVLAAPAYTWMQADRTAGTKDTLAKRIAPPDGFHRVAAAPGGFADWLRGLPLKPPRTLVRLYDGRPKWFQGAHFAVIDIDTGKRDLQQCADAVMRLRAEYLYASGRAPEIAFNETGARRAMSFAKWARGQRPRLSGKRLVWRRRARPDASYRSFRRYMNIVFAYAGTYSLSRELPAKPVSDMAIGDVFVQGGFPGHAVLVADMAVNDLTGDKRFLLIQSFMPAQDMHVLRNPADPQKGPWYSTRFGDTLQTPEWRFTAKDLKHWR